VIKYFKDNPNVQYKTFTVKSQTLGPNDIIQYNSEVRIYRDDVFKSISNGSDGFGQTINAITNLVIYP
jgi:hypothetical protein